MDGFGYSWRIHRLLRGCVLHPSSAPVSFLMTSHQSISKTSLMWSTFTEKTAFTDQEVTLTADVTDHIHSVAGDRLVFWVGE